MTKHSLRPMSDWLHGPDLNKFIDDMTKMEETIKTMPGPKTVFMHPDMIRQIGYERGEDFQMFGLPVKPCDKLYCGQIVVSPYEDYPFDQTSYARLEEEDATI